jgi:hypothetical protein
VRPAQGYQRSKISRDLPGVQSFHSRNQMRQAQNPNSISSGRLDQNDEHVWSLAGEKLVHRSIS